jgi:MFS family permease
MSFVMTATPISMHHQAGHSLEATKWVIQSHIAAMYLPSIFFAALLDRLGYRAVLWAGVAAMALALVIALAGTQLFNYWVALAVLGVGWNFLFLAGTNLLPMGYLRAERFRVQSFNDFLTFTVQALVSLSSGWFLFQFQWQGLLWTGGGMLLLYAFILWRSRAFDLLGQLAGKPGREANPEWALRQVDFDD